jgi:hypothetical protein
MENFNFRDFALAAVGKTMWHFKPQTPNFEQLAPQAVRSARPDPIKAASIADAHEALRQRNLDDPHGRGIVRKHTPFGKHIALVVKNGKTWALHATKGWRVVGAA